MQNYCISVDWLSAYCHGDKINAGTYSGRSYEFTIYEKTEETKLFKHIVEVYAKKVKVAVITQCPRNVVINPKTTIIKLENRVLYSSCYIDMLYAIIEALNLRYKGITRIDLCYDCQYLFGGRDPQRFLRHFLLKKEFSQGHIIRNGSRRCECYFTRKSGEAMVVNGVRFGSRLGKVGAYVYNKSLELIEVKDKPWIREFWRMNGLIDDVDFKHMNALTPQELKKKNQEDSLVEYVHNPIWRFELSIKAEGTKVVDLSTGELFAISPSYVEHQQDLHQLFYDYAAKYFDFRIYAGLNRIKDYAKLQIFEKAGTRFVKPLSVSIFKDCGRTEKMCFNTLDKLSKRFDDAADSLIFGLAEAKNFLLWLSADKYTRYKKELTEATLPLWRRGRDILQESLSMCTAMRFSNLDTDELFLRAKSLGLIKVAPKDFDDRLISSDDIEDIDPALLSQVTPYF